MKEGDVVSSKAERSKMAACSCANHASAAPCAVHGEALPIADAVLDAVFNTPSRRAFLKWLGVPAALSLIADHLPLGDLHAASAAAGPLEKTDLTIGFVPIVCCAPLMIADALELYKGVGLKVALTKTPGWAAARERLENGTYDASHLLVPLSFAMSMGLGGAQRDIQVPIVQNTNGQNITLSIKHKDKKTPESWRGLKFGVPHDFSMQNLILRHLVAEKGLDPDKDLSVVAVPPPQMVAKLEAGEIDGFMGPEPMGQVAVAKGLGFLALISTDIWDGHPCCGFAAPASFVQSAPNTFIALMKAISSASQQLSDDSTRRLVASAMAGEAYLNTPKDVLEAVLLGSFDDGLGNKRTVVNRVTFDPYPRQAIAIWVLSQLRRWGYQKEAINYAAIAEKVFRTAEAKKFLAAAGIRVKDDDMAARLIMGKNFDPSTPDAYISSFAIRRT
jgi:nitrate/nitrite transport system substrate-binding protein